MIWITLYIKRNHTDRHKSATGKEKEVEVEI